MATAVLVPLLLRFRAVIVPRRRPSKAEREQEHRADARADRLHLVGLTNAGVIIMGVVLGAAVIVLVVLMITRH